MTVAQSARRARARLWLAALGLAVLTALTSFAGISYVTGPRWVDHTLALREGAAEWLNALLDADGSARAYADTGDPDLLNDYRDAIGRERAIAERLRQESESDPVQAENVERARRDARALSASLERLVTQGGPASAAARLRSERDLELRSVRTDLARIRTEEARVLEERRARLSLRAILTVIGGLGLSLACFGLIVSGLRARGSREELLDRAAREARERLRALSDVAAALSGVKTRREVAGVVIDRGVQALGADTCTLYMLDASGRKLELLGDRGVAGAVLDRIRHLSAASGSPAFDTLASGRALWAESESDYHALFPQLAALPVEGPRAKAFWSVPLVVEGRPVGLLGMGFYRARMFSPDDRVFADTLAKQCAQALFRAARLEREDETRRWFTTTLRSIGDAVIATDQRGLITFMNPVAEELTAFSEEDARGRPLEEVFYIFAEHTRAPVESPVAKVLREGKIVGLANHTVLRSRRGDEIPIDDSGAPIRSEDGELLGVVLVFRDVRREKAERARRDFLARAGEALVASLDYQVTLQTVAHLAVPVIADWCAIDMAEPGAAAPSQVTVAHVNPAKLRFARELAERYPADPNAERGVPEVIRSGKSELYTEIPGELLEAAARDAEHLRLIRELELRSAMVVPLNAGGRTLGAVTFAFAESNRRYGPDDLAFAEDFARRAAMAIENARALRQVEEARAQEHRLRAEAEIASRAKDEFLAMVSHELRTPLNAILGWAVMLRTRGTSENLERGLAVIERNARAQAKLIEDVLDVSRIISGKLALSLGPTNLADAVTAAVETVSPAAQAKDITIEVEVSDTSLILLADADRVQQIVWNLLSNAVKFTPKNGRVKLRAFRDGSEVAIEVTDTGEGIRPEAQPYVFEPFQQADSSTTRRHGGLGLGLAIVKQLVTAHGGTVRAVSEGIGKGATFIVRLPARSAIPAISRAANRGDGVEVSVDGEATARLDDLKLLVIDDESDARTLVGQVLRQHGAQVVEAASARAALDQMHAQRFDVIVSDIGMPDEDGYTLIRRIRTLPVEEGGRTPAVALTAYARTEDSQRAFAAGYQRHVVKPIEPAQLVTVVANLGGRSLTPPDPQG